MDSCSRSTSASSYASMDYDGTESLTSDTNMQTTRQGYVNLCRGSLGPGMLALPHVFLFVGYGLGMGLLAVLSFVIMLNMILLVETKHFCNDRRKESLRAKEDREEGEETEVCTYPDIGREVWGRAGKIGIEVILVALELGICTVYFVFLATNLGVVISHTSVTQHRVMMLLMYPVLTGLTQIRFMKQLAPLSGFANGCMLTVRV
jgi:proton-coupled amino acid transporter